MKFKRMLFLDNLMFAFTPVIILLNIITGKLCIDSTGINRDFFSLLSGLFFLLMYAVYKHYMEKKNKILAYKTLNGGEKILDKVEIKSIFGYVFIFVCGLVICEATLLAMGYIHNNIGHLNSSFAPFLLILLAIFVPISIFFFTCANVYITDMRICIIWNDLFIKSLFGVKNSNYAHKNICTIKTTGLIFKKITVKYSDKNKYELNSLVVKNYKKAESILEEIASL